MMNYLDLFAQLMLKFSHETVILPLLIIGYIWINRDIFFHSICLILISMIFNASLKATFQIPLNPSIGKEGFAFPSGHMQTSVVLYGFLYRFVKHKALKLCLITLLIMIGASLIYCGYHNLMDVSGGAIFALILIGSYKYLIFNRSHVKVQCLFIPIMCFVSICLIYIKLTHIIHPHLWMSYYALIGLILAQAYLEYKEIKHPHTKTTKMIASICCFALLFLINAVFAIKSEVIALISPLRWFCIGISIPFSVLITRANI